ncbi:hypothetical protein [Streptomyces rapamycinicus]|uniref:Uncharacterized protein n=2 Tax=Streptomyces rapamycinicus TaxID=1226757 RepID=A0A0A0NH80_STRRN|nr:hypothetical protein [Streptomyces rapamycinicus]AGP56339.1 hypothetical protein M271_24220 [Streptomyces rapamycinicus NRRL 5491]MBB4783934.1 hypothetical protein [Streptomyces rapamycinicus]RLV80578.1 hypothetical protein D3C57_119375 [Streptomyces rapamycinicus NRRL 5491]UTO64293.1 hypothetical protein LJB45_19490 [Streptomyces rapamycinicus]UTP32248.1 hypothetical protein LIV37_24615 [Streptomyces rapamycinicus NRRL 5491]
MSRYAAAKPYVLPESLDELCGSTVGSVTLPRHIDWGPRYVYDLTDEADFRLMYERVIREAQTRDDLNAYLNAMPLRRMWRDLFLPLPVKTAWETRFPELREPGATTAAA